jgi:hypothetical protein
MRFESDIAEFKCELIKKIIRFVSNKILRIQMQIHICYYSGLQIKFGSYSDYISDLVLFIIILKKPNLYMIREKLSCYLKIISNIVAIIVHIYCYSNFKLFVSIINIATIIIVCSNF